MFADLIVRYYLERFLKVFYTISLFALLIFMFGCDGGAPSSPIEDQVSGQNEQNLLDQAYADYEALCVGQNQALIDEWVEDCGATLACQAIGDDYSIALHDTWDVISTNASYSYAGCLDTWGSLFIEGECRGGYIQSLQNGLYDCSDSIYYLPFQAFP